MKTIADNKSADSSLDTLKRTWLIRFVVVLLAVAAGGCLVADNNALTLIEKSIGSFLIALFIAETLAIVVYFIKRPSFVMTAYLIAKAFNLPYGKAQS